MKTAVDFIGRKALSLSEEAGELALLTKRTFSWAFRGGLNRRLTLQQMVEMGARTFPVTSMAVLFTGMVLALQTGYSFIKVFNEPLYVGRLIGISIAKELGPVFCALVFAGRIGAAIAAELGTMTVTEQVDALYTLGTNPVKYLCVPRFVAAVTMLPILTIYADFLGVLGGYAVAYFKFQIPATVYWNEVYALELKEVFHGLTKSVFFALIIVSIACYKGLKASGGAEGVGKATTSSVVFGMMSVLITDYFLSALLVAFGIG